MKEKMNRVKRISDERNKALISVIVPIYNVERYVRKCLDSLKGQTMKEIEVICIDDGSTDSSGAIADEYCNTDAGRKEEAFPLIRVIHTRNKGLSAARNLGIREARAEWLMFVDSDDRVDRRFCEKPYRAALEADADLVIFGLISEDEKKKRKDLHTDGDGVIDEYTAHESGRNNSYNKLYHRGLFQDIRFPEGRFYEDLATTHKLVHKARKIIRISDYLYFQTKRPDSITHTPSETTMRDYFYYSCEKNDAMIAYGYSDRIDHDRVVGPAIVYLAISKTKEDDLYKKARKIVERAEGFPNCLSWKQKAALAVWRIDPGMFHLLGKIKQRSSFIPSLFNKAENIFAKGNSFRP